MQDVYVDQDILDRIFGLYDVHFASATIGSAISAHIDGIDEQSAMQLKEMVLAKIKGGYITENNNSSQNNNQAGNNQKINLTEKISSSEYGLTGKWLTMQMFTNLFGSIIGAFILSFFISFFVFGMTPTGIGERYFHILYILFPILLVSGIIRILFWKNNYRFSLEDDHLYFKIGVLSIKETNMPYYSIQDVSVTQSFFERIFGLYDIAIKNASQNIITGNEYSRQTINMQNPFLGGPVITGLNKELAEKISLVIKDILSKTNSGRTGL
jgi:uncharacterized membrane protein YdbT with pleckstrin-like domain